MAPCLQYFGTIAASMHREGRALRYQTRLVRNVKYRVSAMTHHATSFQIFANHHDDVKADTSTWPLAYNTLARLLHPEAGDSRCPGSKGCNHPGVVYGSFVAE
jgi:hypothetical protein